MRRGKGIVRQSLREAFREFPPETRTVPLIHPGVVLKEDFLDPMGITQTELAHAIGVTINRINEICRGKRAISPETAWLLAAYFDMSVEFWAGLQQQYDLELAGIAIADKLKLVRRGQGQRVPQTA